MTTAVHTEPIELECPNDGCPGLDVDGELEQGRMAWVETRHRWTAELIVDESGKTGYVDPDTERCALCGTVGDEVE